MAAPAPPQQQQAASCSDGAEDDGAGEQQQPQPAPQEEELHREVQQLQAQNEELQAELRHLAATARAALAADPNGAALLLDLDCDAAAASGCSILSSDDAGVLLAAGRPLADCRASGQGQVPAGSRSSSSDCDCASPALSTPAPSSHSAAAEPAAAAAAPAQASAPLSSSQPPACSGGCAMLPPGPPPPACHPAGSGSPSLSCSLQHPGSVCCSQLNSAEDPSGPSYTISLHTTARCADRGSPSCRQLAPEGLQALAAHALAGTAHSFSQAVIADYRQKTGPPPAVAVAHADLQRLLQRGVVICAQRTPPSPFGHPSFLLTLQDPLTAARVRAIFKPRMCGDAGGWHRTPMEWVAYRLNLLLGMDLVPPVAYRTAPLAFRFDGDEEEIVCAEGAAMLWVEGCKQLREVRPEEWGVDPSVLLSDTRILDVLLHNSDRHHGHFLFGPHWALGGRADGRFLGALRPALIDHAASFRREAVVAMHHNNAFGWGPARCVSASTYLRLRFLDAHTIREELGAHLSGDEQRQLLLRRDHILRYFDDLVGAEGYAATVRE